VAARRLLRRKNHTKGRLKPKGTRNPHPTQQTRETNQRSNQLPKKAPKTPEP